MEEGLSRSDAIFTTATELGSINNNSTEFEEDQVSEKSKNQYEYCQRNFKIF